MQGTKRTKEKDRTTNETRDEMANETVITMRPRLRRAQTTQSDNTLTRLRTSQEVTDTTTHSYEQTHSHNHEHHKE